MLQHWREASPIDSLVMARAPLRFIWWDFFPARSAYCGFCLLCMPSLHDMTATDSTQSIIQMLICKVIFVCVWVAAAATKNRIHSEAWLSLSHFHYIPKYSSYLSYKRRHFGDPLSLASPNLCWRNSYKAELFLTIWQFVSFLCNMPAAHLDVKKKENSF